MALFLINRDKRLAMEMIQRLPVEYEEFVAEAAIRNESTKLNQMSIIVSTFAPFVHRFVERNPLRTTNRLELITI